MTVVVDLDALMDAFADASPALDYFVDRETGEVILVSETLGFIEAGLQRAQIAEDPGRYLKIPVSGLDELIADLDLYIDDLDDETTRERLDALLDAPDPAAALTVYLARHGDIAGAWAAHRRDRMRDRALRWLRENGLKWG